MAGFYTLGRYIEGMRSFLIVGVLCAALSGAALQASILPTVHIDPASLKIFQDYIAAFEKTDVAAFTSGGKLWIDNECCAKRSLFDSGKTVVEARENKDVAGGSIHHFTGVLHVSGGTIEAVRRVMQDYVNYPAYFRPDVGVGTGEKMPDSTPADEHFHTSLLLTQSTLWINVAIRTLNDTHYLRLDPDHWLSRSASMSIQELLDTANPNGASYPQGNDHGFIWKTSTYWFVRQRNGGLDLEANSITVSRQTPTGFGWWATKRTRDAVDKMLTDVQSAISRK
jgi:hypothetical protein